MSGVKLSIRTPKHQDIREVRREGMKVGILVRGGRRGDVNGGRLQGFGIGNDCGTVSVFFAAQAQGLLSAVVVDHVEHVVVEVSRAVAALVHLEPVLLGHLGLHGRAVQVCQQGDYRERQGIYSICITCQHDIFMKWRERGEGIKGERVKLGSEMNAQSRPVRSTCGTYVILFAFGMIIAMILCYDFLL
jgi:hypothetical protein